MGTNWYWRDRICVPCGRYDEIHVCKSGGTFRAYRNVLVDPGHPDWGHYERSPFGEEIRSRADWVRILTNRPGELWDSYGERVDDPITWLATFPAPTAEDIARVDASLARGRYADLRDRTQEWRDPEGFLFFAREFS